MKKLIKNASLLMIAVSVLSVSVSFAGPKKTGESADESCEVVSSEGSKGSGSDSAGDANVAPKGAKADSAKDSKGKK